ncbi:hypothetical protein ACWZHB_25010 [Nocardia sp. FBN12]|uniref:hypothetical protein n=1 Tax=Nocardia sp. FBN12 TaxID=3419766 RepID=UPI003D06E593
MTPYAATTQAVKVHDPMADVERALAAQVGWNWVDDHLLYACKMLSRLRAGGIAALDPYPTSIVMEEQETCFGEGQGLWAVFRSPELPPPPPTIAPAVIAAVSPSTPVFVAPRGSSRRDIQRARTAANAAAFNARQRSERMAVQMVQAAADAARVANAAAAAAREQATSHYLELATPWAAPAFLIASQARFPHHPQLISGSWLPHGFEERCHIAGKACQRVR